jgi:hypothetical protein
MEQHPVPQNVTTFQFRLIGDMTIKQFGYLAGGAILGYIIYKLPFPAFISLPIGVGVFLLGFGFAFVPVEERPMDIWFLAFIKSIYSPTLYVWQRQKPIPEPGDQTVKNPVVNQVKQGLHQPAPVPTPIKPISNQPVVSPVMTPPKPPVTNPPQTVKQGPLIIAKTAIPSPAVIAPKPVNTGPTTPPIKPAAPQPAKQATPPVIPAKILTQKPSSHKPGFFQWIFSLFNPKRIPNDLPKSQPIASSSSKQPDIFAHMPTPVITGKRIDLPGQSVTSAPVTNKPKEDSGPNQPAPVSPETTASIEKAEAKSKELEDKLSGLQQELHQKTASESRIIELQKQLTEILSERQNMQNELATLKMQLEKSRNAPAATTIKAGYTTSEPAKPTIKVITPESAVRAGLPKLTTFPNVVTGIIKDNEGNLLPGVLVTVRDKDDIPVRALKTNKLGQFAASTPLPNNTYYIEVEDPRNRYVFDRIQISINGGVIPAVEVVAKSQKELSREKLQKEIFGNQQI